MHKHALVNKKVEEKRKKLEAIMSENLLVCENAYCVNIIKRL